MARLSNLKSPLSTLPPRLGRVTDDHGHSKASEPWRKWYHLARWKRLRMAVLLRDSFTCQHPTCGLIQSDTSQLVADHVTPHRGNPHLFWSESNIQTLCKPCHDSLKQAAEKRAAPTWA
jgi:5-methylcytosine-specific restriction endonuclease McrA